jgi:hypothetical protein
LVREIIHCLFELFIGFLFEFALDFAVVYQGAKDIEVYGDCGQVDENPSHGVQFLFLMNVKRKSFELYGSNNTINLIYQVGPTKHKKIPIRKHLLEPGTFPNYNDPG